MIAELADPSAVALGEITISEISVLPLCLCVEPEEESDDNTHTHKMARYCCSSLLSCLVFRATLWVSLSLLKETPGPRAVPLTTRMLRINDPIYHPLPRHVF